MAGIGTASKTVSSTLSSAASSSATTILQNVAGQSIMRQVSKVNMPWPGCWGGAGTLFDIVAQWILRIMGVSDTRNPIVSVPTEKEMASSSH